MSEEVMLARVNLRDLARQVEEAALVLEARRIPDPPR